MTKNPSEMPRGFLYYVYAGRETKSGREIVWQAKLEKGDDGSEEISDEFVAAYALAALDAGYIVGEPWKWLYDHAADRTTRLALGRAIARALNEASDQRKLIAGADGGWIREHIIVGMTRNAAYAELRPYGLIAYNSAYSQGVPIALNGMKSCDFRDQGAAAWPYHGELLPKRSGECAFVASNPGPFPSASIVLPGAFNIACDSETDVTITFDGADRVKAVTISDPRWECI